MRQKWLLRYGNSPNDLFKSHSSIFLWTENWSFETLISYHDIKKLQGQDFFKYSNILFYYIQPCHFSKILLNLSMKCWNSAFNAQDPRVIIVVVQK